ncbi:MAG TPA: DUF58 domain-containing protein [Verrucomicrobiae bacterium]|nr:DUF58 domain-containing protein [Verrucomicrobiae bacterium]
MAEGLNKYLDPQVVGRLMAQPLAARFAMEGNVSGHHRSPHRGSSVEFAEYRNYTPGDDIRRLDWRVFARSDRFYLKEFEAETNLRCYLVLDASASMGFAGKGEAKIDYAKRMAASLAYVTVHQGDAASLVAVGPKTVKDLPPRRNPAHLQTLLQMLEDIPPEGETGLVAALHDLAERVRRRALVVVISDFFCDLEPLLGALQHLRFQKHDLVLFQLMDRMELDFKFDRPVRFVDLESPFSLVTEPATVRDEYLRQLHQFLERLKGGCREFKADHRLVVTDQNYEQVLADFLVERARLAAMGVQ